ncbi:MAG: excisionase/Xis, DNA-binding [Nocardioides sp.]|jgi:predicted DNA-binding transcriptional regulator AlpA|nr:excisionase/Xis, DNA-binding [Nocardioides sp.]
MSTRKTPAVPERLWTLEETAGFLCIPVSTLYKLNHKRTGPRFFRVGRHCRYDPRDVFSWLESPQCQPG